LAVNTNPKPSWLSATASSPPPAACRSLELARFAAALLSQPLEKPADAIELELHHVLQRERKPAATVLVIEQAEDALPELIGIDGREQAI
jgi:hypothetical protein